VGTYFRRRGNERDDLPPMDLSISASILWAWLIRIRVGRCDLYDAVDRLRPEMAGCRPCEHQRDVCIRDRVQFVIYPSNADLQIGGRRAGLERGVVSIPSQQADRPTYLNLWQKRSAMRKSSFLIAERTLACSW